MRTVLEVLNLSIDYLQKRNIQHPRRQAEELLGEALGVGRMGLYLQFDRPLTDAELTMCRDWLKRRGQGEPLQHISGQVEFLDCVIKVSQDVLIPRQETEILVDKIVNELKSRDLTDQVLFDICCGSGCIGIAIKKQLPQLKVILSDISSSAVQLTKNNAQENQVEVEVLEGDLFTPFKGLKADYIVCNPPYIAESELAGLDLEVRSYEPKNALVSGETGLEFYERLAGELSLFLKSGGKAWFEIGTRQGNAVKSLFLGEKWKSPLIEFDWAGHERFFSLEIE